MNRVLVVGIPRSGTTWVGHVLGETHGAVYVGEPDNHLKAPFALRAKRRMGMRDFPALTPGSPSQPYEALWDSAFAVRDDQRKRPSTLESLRGRVANALLDRSSRSAVLAASREGSQVGLRLAAAAALAVPERPAERGATLVVKSVYAPLSVEWIAHRLPVRVVVVLRSPLNVLSSWVKLNWLGRPGDDMLDLVSPVIRDELAARWSAIPPPSGSPVVARAAWLVAALACSLREAAERHEDWLVVRHEQLCAAPSQRFAALADALGLGWTPEDARRLAGMNRAGDDFEPFRVADGLKEAWRSRLDEDQLRVAESVLARFPLRDGPQPF